MTVDYRVGHVLDVLATIPDGTVDLVTTSPPFLALRDYNGIEGQWGSEPTPAAFLDNLLELTTQLRRVLTPHGSIAIELGDTYSGKSGWGDDDGNDRYPNGRGVSSAIVKPNASGPGWPRTKSLTGVPTLYAWSLAYGHNLLNPTHTITPWRVRNIIVWARNNPPVGALGDKYRPATSYITVACPSPRRWFDLDAVRVEPKPHTLRYPRDAEHYSNAGYDVPTRADGGRIESNAGNPAGAPPTDHWTDEPDGDLTWLINTQGSSLAHYAMWPPKLVERLVLSMCPAHVCRTCGEPRRRITGPAEYHRTDSDRVPARLTKLDGCRPSDGVNQHTRPDGANTSVIAHRPTLGWSDCGHNTWRPGHVLDPFAGTGTTLAAADIHGRDATGIDLDPHNPSLYPTRYAQCWDALKPDAGPSPLNGNGHQLQLLGDL